MSIVTKKDKKKAVAREERTPEEIEKLSKLEFTFMDITGKPLSAPHEDRRWSIHSVLFDRYELHAGTKIYTSYSGALASVAPADVRAKVRLINDATRLERAQDMRLGRDRTPGIHYLWNGVFPGTISMASFLDYAQRQEKRIQALEAELKELKEAAHG